MHSDEDAMDASPIRRFFLVFLDVYRPPMLEFGGAHSSSPVESGNLGVLSNLGHWSSLN